jgi:hypothetical protein
MENVVSLDKYQFRSLRKYMAPLYAELNRSQHEASEKKLEARMTIATRFFVRLRNYRGISLGDLSETAKIPVEELAAFERGERNGNRRFVSAYLRACSAHDEMEYFRHQLLAHENPSLRETTLDCATDAFRRFGIKLPGVDYRHLGAQRGVVVPLRQ